MEAICLLVNQVVLPSLHMSLGIFKKLFDMLEAQCHELDMKLFSLCVTNTDEDDDDATPECNFDQQVYAEYKRQILITEEKQKKEEELEQVEEELPLHLLQNNLQAIDQTFQDMAKRAFTLRQELQELVSLFLQFFKFIFFYLFLCNFRFLFVYLFIIIYI